MLAKATLAFELVEGERRLHTVPKDAVVRILAEPTHRHDDALVPVLWDGKIVSMFAIDITKRGALLGERGATA